MLNNTESYLCIRGGSDCPTLPIVELHVEPFAHPYRAVVVELNADMLVVETGMDAVETFFITHGMGAFIL